MFPFDLSSWLSHSIDFSAMATPYIVGLGIFIFAVNTNGPRLPRLAGAIIGALVGLGTAAWAGASVALEIEYAAQCGSTNYVLIRDEPHVEQRIIDPGKPDPRIIYVPCGG